MSDVAVAPSIGIAARPAPAASAPAKIGLLKRLYRRLRAIFAMIGVLFVVYHLGFDLSVVTSPSMSPTLQGDTDGGDYILSERITYCFRKPRRWEIVSFRKPDHVQVMKRVAALPGERVTIVDKWVQVNGAALARPYGLDFLVYYPFGPYVHNGKSVDCGDGYFVLGDLSKDSDDSRFEGPLNPSQINGRPWLRVWPMNRFGFVNP